MLLTETWLDDSSNVPVFIASALTNFHFMNLSRPEREGDGVAAILKD